MIAVNVGNSLAISLTSLLTREFLLEQGLMNARNVGSLLARALTSLNSKEFTLKKGLMSAVNGKFFISFSHLFQHHRVHTCLRSHVMNVENSLPTHPTSLNTREFTLEKGHLSVVNMESPLAANITPFHTVEFTWGKAL